ncbi:MAG: GNAT family N-acetyltransferase, partial [Proteobacteria bacterium]|nr:GNAT family N-acetyltransferase [Pseudomonadota bacterium]
VAPRIVEATPAPRAFFSGLLGGKVVASGLTVVDGEVASIQCMATLSEARRMGAARAVLGAIEANAARHGAKWLYLQAEAENMPAIRLYEGIGFRVAGHYHTRELAS